MQHLTIAKINWLMLFKEIITVYTENHHNPEDQEWHPLCYKNLKSHVDTIPQLYSHFMHFMQEYIMKQNVKRKWYNKNVLLKKPTC
jgi:hypothetical protein